MTESATAITWTESSSDAGLQIGTEIYNRLGGQSPDLLLVFCSSRYNYAELLNAVHEAAHPKILTGCSSAGEFIGQDHRVGAVSAIGIRSEYLKFSVGLGRNLRADQSGAVSQVVSSFRGIKAHQFRFRTALILTDILAGYTEELIQELVWKTDGQYQFIGGGAGDDGHFSKTHVFLGTEALTDAVVALEILSDEPVAIGVKHGWQASSIAMKVTDAEENRLISLNSLPAVEAFKDYAEATHQPFDLKSPLTFFLENALGIRVGFDYRIRVPLSIHEDGSITCAANIPKDSTIHIMRTTLESATNAALTASQAALAQMKGNSPKVALFFDCVATRLRMGKGFQMELEALSQSLDGALIAGCNTYGQIARVDGQFSGFHNCTAVVCLLP